MLKVYGIIRLCNYHEGCTTCGPPIGVYYSYDKAYRILSKWKREHSWDKVEYMIKAYEVYDEAPLLNNTVYGVIRRCKQDHFGFEVGADCGPMIGVYTSEEHAKKKIEGWTSSHVWDSKDYVIRKMRVKGDRRHLTHNFTILERRHSLDI